jgi:hypothetical protein
MYTVGNNDLCPDVPYVLGNGSELTKMNPVNVEYFFTFEHPYEIPRSSSGKYIPCIYSFIYGNTYFLSMNSEITNDAIVKVFNHSGNNIYSDTIKEWCDKDLTHLDDTITWKVAYCHEAPFTILTDAVVEGYLKYYNGDASVTVEPDRGGTRMNTVGNYWFSRFLQNNGFNLCMCGHKHTFSNSRYIREPEPDENGKHHSMVIDVYDPEGENALWYQALLENEKDYRVLVNVSDDASKGWVKYVMAQATGYKLKSNKELPGLHLPFLKEYYKVTPALKVNNGQLYPNYIVWNIGKGKETETEYLWNYSTHKIDEPSNPSLSESRDRIVGHSKKLWNRDKSTLANSKEWAYKYNMPVSLDSVDYYGGNGESANSGSNNIIIEKLV